MYSYVLIAIGSAVGGVARFWCSSWIAERAGETFPWGTLAVNVGGSFLIGLIAGLAAPEGRFYLNPEWRQLLMIGVLGGFTTFSSFSLQTLMLLRDGDWLGAFANVALSVSACLGAVWAGYAAAEALAA